MMPPPLPLPAMLTRAPAPFAPAYAQIYFWPYPSPPVSPTSYYNPASVPGMMPIPQQAAILTPPECLQLAPPEPHMDALIPRPDIDKRIHPSLQVPCHQYIDLFIV
ncbi:PREDICTED: leucine-rich repeat extensin-like protein 3 [Ceratosolen solmsi marchali]|uniref:Leucine-rich repeat extensin-like protein 3 n=1 Tax=Ceratosolen solmsi marchali TaxID=326594 RepID=A0AAJ6YTX3_9HYME|nr:PREDICTED: leucine-rich repeat extensin-like protein 3 [Ceratosolen solmsi marchali]